MYEKGSRFVKKKDPNLERKEIQIYKKEKDSNYHLTY